MTDYTKRIAEHNNLIDDVAEAMLDAAARHNSFFTFEDILQERLIETAMAAQVDGIGDGRTLTSIATTDIGWLALPPDNWGVRKHVSCRLWDAFDEDRWPDSVPLIEIATRRAVYGIRRHGWMMSPSPSQLELSMWLEEACDILATDMLMAKELAEPHLHESFDEAMSILRVGIGFEHALKKFQKLSQCADEAARDVLGQGPSTEVPF